ncbi:MAG: hypothetical protein ABR498_09055 [Candidatus Dormibacteria bacterium]
MSSTRRRLLAGITGAALTALVWTGSTTASAQGSPVKHMMGIRGGGNPNGNPNKPGGGGGGAGGSAGKNLSYHGGPIEQATVVYLDFWGSAWGGTTGSAQTYLQGFYGNVGGSSWINTDTQYCQGVASGTVNCGSSGTHITNPTSQLKGTWNDAGNPPANRQIQDSDVANEAVNAMNHFGGYNGNATYIVLTPSGDSESGFAANGGSWCAWHSDTASGGNTLAYAYVPYQPDAAASCGENFVNSGSAGYYDGFSIVGGHEYEEAQTDPHLNAWYDRQSSEDADKCAWNSLSGDVTLGGTQYAVQPLWDNLKSGCVISGP